MRRYSRAIEEPKPFSALIVIEGFGGGPVAEPRNTQTAPAGEWYAKSP